MKREVELSTDKKRKYSPRGRPVKRGHPRIMFYIDIVDDEKAVLYTRLQQKRYESTMKYEQEHKNEKQWWD